MTETNKTIVEYKAPEKRPVSALGAVGATLGGAALLGVIGNTMGNTVSRYAGQIANNIGAGGSIPLNIAPAVTPVAANVIAAPGCGYVTKDESGLIREISAKDSVIARLEAEKYTDNVVKEAVREVRYELKSEVEPLKQRVCELEKFAAVNEVSDRDYRRYAERAFVHQPKAYMRSRIVTCEDPQCGCKHEHDNCDSGYHGW